MRPENFESLSEEDLRAIAERMGLDLPPDLDRIFVVEEVVEALEEDRLEPDRGTEAPLYVEDAKYWCRDASGTEGGPRSNLAPRYNETCIKAIVRDPAWAFALWDISDTDRSSLEVAREEARLFLRVTEAVGGDGAKPLFFDIPVDIDDVQWYINLPQPESIYRIDLAMKVDGRVRLLARSEEFAVPRQFVDESGLAPDARRLLELSGIQGLALRADADANPNRILPAGA